MKKILTIVMIAIVAMTFAYADAFIAYDYEDFIAVYASGEDLRFVDIESYSNWEVYRYYDDSILEAYPYMISSDIMELSSTFTAEYINDYIDVRVITDGEDMIYLMSNWYDGINWMMEYLENV